jgi:hypothetical protein
MNTMMKRLSFHLKTKISQAKFNKLLLNTPI